MRSCGLAVRDQNKCYDCTTARQSDRRTIKIQHGYFVTKYITFAY
jgi:hypothetical protein